jgi:hypothetical protein
MEYDPSKADATCGGTPCDKTSMPDQSACCKDVTYPKCSSVETQAGFCGAGKKYNMDNAESMCSGYPCTSGADLDKCCKDDGGDDESKAPACSVTDGSKASPFSTGSTKNYEECTCAGAAKECSALNVCDVVKKTCTCTPGKDHWCYNDKKRTYAVKFGCFYEGEADGKKKYEGFKCDGDNVGKKSYSDDKCTTELTVENGGRIQTFTPTKVTTVRMSDGQKKTIDDTETFGISTCKGGVAGAGAGAAAPGPSAAAPGPSAELASEDAGSVAQCSTLAMLFVVVAMWAGRN